MTGPLGDLVARLRASGAGPDELYEEFVAWALSRGLTLYPHQDEALLELLSGANVVLATPTGSGKSLVATALHLATLAAGGRTYYTAPIKALVSEKFFALCDDLGPELVGMVTGDGAVNPEAPVICCTAEILANLALRTGGDSGIASVVMDECHYYGDSARGWAWQVPLLELNRPGRTPGPRPQFLLMSATLGDVREIARDLSRRTERPTAVVDQAVRPVPLTYSWSVRPVHETIEELVGDQKAPAYVVHSRQADAVERAQALASVTLATREARDAIAATIQGFRFTAGFGRTLSRLLRLGIGVHHAGMLPRYRRLVERLAQAGLLSVICGTDTLGVGINVPIRTVLFTRLVKYDGHRSRTLSAREFHQIAGRAGRSGFDTTGYVVAEAPEHVIENERALAKAGDDPKARRKVVRKKPAPGSVNYGRETFERLVEAEPEALRPHLRVTHAMVLQVAARPGDLVASMAALLTDNHQDPPTRRRLVRRALAIGRSLVQAGILVKLTEPDAEGRTYALTVDLQRDFALNQPLSAFALAAFDVLDPASPSYAVDLVSVIEATLEDPMPVLLAQQRAAKGEAVRQMKEEGIDYAERMELLADVTWPKPLADVLAHVLGFYRQSHPWLPDALSPKSVVRELYEQGLTFTEYVALYGLGRSEGVLLRYLSDAYRALRHTVPVGVQDEAFADLVAWLGELVRQTDSSLVSEWEALVADDVALSRADDVSARPLTANVRAFRVLVRNAMWRRIELLAREDAAGLADCDAGAEPGPSRAEWDAMLDDYFDEHDDILLDADARGPARLVVTEEGRLWRVRQIVSDPEGDHDWAITAVVDLDASDDAGDLVLRTEGLSRLD